MNTTQANPALIQMEDIVLPPPISHLPVAPGYWILTALVIIAAVMLIIKRRKSVKYHASRKAAMSQLALLDINDVQFAIHINTLLKRTALSYLPRQDFAKLDGEKWFTWLDLRLPASDKGAIGKLLAKRYQACGLSSAENIQLLALTTHWFNKKTHFESIEAITVTKSKKTNVQEASCSQ